MKNVRTLQVTTPTEREIVIEREFNAPRRFVFDALTKPDLIRRWLLGPPGWSMPVCEVDLRVGGRYLYRWRKEDGTEMGVSGVFREIEPPGKIVHTEKFDEAWYPGEAVITSTIVERGNASALTMTLLYESREARDIALQSGMESGMEAGFARLEEILEKARRSS
jgi:uncharacterized protein YndB with AHSA1/START domain